MGTFFPPEATYKYNFSNLQNFIRDLNQPYKTLFGKFITSYNDYRDILHWLREGVLYAGSDGSVANKIGAHAFCFTNGQQRSCIIGGLHQPQETRMK